MQKQKAASKDAAFLLDALAPRASGDAVGGERYAAHAARGWQPDSVNTPTACNTTAASAQPCAPACKSPPSAPMNWR